MGRVIIGFRKRDVAVVAACICVHGLVIDQLTSVEIQQAAGLEALLPRNSHGLRPIIDNGELSKEINHR